MRSFSPAALALAGLLALAPHAVAAPAPGALALSWQGHADTDLQLPALLAGDHTLMARFMMQFPNAGAGPLFANKSSTGTFSVTKDNYDQSRLMQLTVTYGNKSATFPFPSTPDVAAARLIPADSGGFKPQLDIAWRAAVRARWFHLALVRSGPTVKVFLDGVRLAAVSGNTDTAGNLDLAGVSNLPSGTASVLRLGRLAGALPSTNAFFSQFYGLIDDVAAFTRAISDVAIQQFAQHPHAVMQAGLVGVYQFNYDPSAIPNTIAHTSTLSGAAFRRHVSASGDNVKDEAVMLSPQHKTVFHLPFKKGVAFLVVWGNQIHSHLGGDAAFSWDFQRVGAGIDVQKATDGQLLAAVAAGKVVQAFDGGDAALTTAEKPKDDLTDGYNFLALEHAPGEQSLYLHVKTGSIREAFTDAQYVFMPDVPNTGDKEANATHLKSVPGGIGVNDGLRVARIGNRTPPGGANNFHLHFSSEFDNAAPLFGVGLVNFTYPLAFSDYWASDHQGGTWYHVKRGIPRTGQWVKRM